MEKRVLIAILLSFLVLYIYQSLVPTPEPARSSTKPETTQSPQKAAAGTPPGAATPTLVTPPAPAATPLVAESAARDVVVETDSIRAVFTTHGAVLKSWRLKRYLDATGQPLELIPADLPTNASRPFTLAVDDAALTERLKGAFFKQSEDSRIERGTAVPPLIAFEYRDDAVSVRKEFRFDAKQPYAVTFAAMIDAGGRAVIPAVDFGPAIASGVNPSGSSSFVLPRVIFFQDGDVSRLAGTALEERTVYDGQFGFAGVDDHYFLTAVVKPPQPLRLIYRPLTLPIAGAAGAESRQLIAWAARMPSAPSGMRYFLGPKDFDVLAAMDRDLVRAIDFGIFAWLVVPLLRALKWINVYVGNYGWSIVLLTVLINAAMFPLRHKSVVSMRKMQEIQPEVKAIQERYAKLKTTDPARQKMNVELMTLYRERGVNPASGCIPMVLTMPVLFAFYAMLSVAIELRGAPFVGWIKDLSLHDPLYITPVVMGATMVWQQRLTPSSADPVQQKVMMFMPIMFTFFFLWAPSGLVLYWLVSNVWAIGQQIVTNRIIGPPKIHAVRPPAERKLKKVGGGQTDQAAREQA